MFKHTLFDQHKAYKLQEKGTINKVNSRCIKQVSIFTAVLLSHNISVSKKSPCALLMLLWSSDAPMECQQWNMRCYNRGMSQSGGVSHGEGGEITIFRIVLKMGPWAAGTTGMYCAWQWHVPTRSLRPVGEDIEMWLLMQMIMKGTVNV